MYILGLNLIHDSSAALIKDGKVLMAIEEERFNKVRHTTSFPRKSIEYCLKYAKITIDAVDHVVTSFDFTKFKNNTNPFEQNILAHDDASIEGKKRILKDNNLIYSNMTQILEKNGPSKFCSVPHHLAHASGAYFMGGFKNANIIVIDGRGEDVSTSIMKGEEGEISVIESYPVKDSLCHLYTYITYLCGLYANIGLEGKTMGLSAYGRPEIDFSKILLIRNNQYEIDRIRMRELIKYKTPLGEITQVSKNLAYSVQKSFERASEFLAKKVTSLTKNNALVLSGGGALNCETNRILFSKDYIKQIYIQPSANDAGTAIGAALYKYNQIKSLKDFKQEDVYLGPSYNSDEIREVLEETKVKFEKSNNVSRATAELLATGKIVGWFQGRMEFGPRALGNRSILADPRNKETKDKINRYVKHRESWRPFAPSILYESMEDYFGMKYSAPHMTISFKVLKEKINDIVAAVHVDGTARIQTVHKEKNKIFHSLIKNFKDITGIPALLNTSFNNNGNPIVCSPQDALGCFFSTGLDVLIMGDYIVEKSNQR